MLNVLSGRASCLRFFATILPTSHQLSQTSSLDRIEQALPRRPHAFRGRNHLQPSHAFHMGQIFLMPEGKWTEAQLWGNPGKPPPDDLPRINIIQYTPSFSLYFLFLFGEPGVKELRLMTCRPCMSIAGKLCTFSHGSSSLVLN